MVFCSSVIRHITGRVSHLRHLDSKQFAASARAGELRREIRASAALLRADAVQIFSSRTAQLSAVLHRLAAAALANQAARLFGRHWIKSVSRFPASDHQDMQAVPDAKSCSNTVRLRQVDRRDQGLAGASARASMRPDAARSSTPQPSPNRRLWGIGIRQRPRALPIRPLGARVADRDDPAHPVADF